MKLLSPHVTEKSAIQSTRESAPVYSFKIEKTANKHEVAKEVFEMYKVKPVRVNIVNVPGKAIVYRGRKSEKSGYKKAMVTLKKGDKIEFA